MAKEEKYFINGRPAEKVSVPPGTVWGGGGRGVSGATFVRKWVGKPPHEYEAVVEEGGDKYVIEHFQDSEGRIIARHRYTESGERSSS